MGGILGRETRLFKAEHHMKQPLINQRALLRLALGLAVIAALFFGFTWFKSLGSDIGDLGPANTAGMLAAIQSTEGGARAIVIRADGRLEPCPDSEGEVVDREVSWQPDGNRLFVSSDREDRTFHLYRWNPESGAISRRTLGTRGYSAPFFPPSNVPNALRSGLTVSGGKVFGFSAREADTPQMLPPVGREVNQGHEGGGVVGQFDALYQTLGQSFRTAQWVHGTQWIAAVMKRDVGEVLILQNMQPTKEQDAAPIPVVSGDRIEIDTFGGILVYSVMNFRLVDPRGAPEEFVKDGVVTIPFRHVVGAIDPQKPAEQFQIARTLDDETAFGVPAISPDGTLFLVTVGPYDGYGAIRANALVTMPIVPEGHRGARTILEGEVVDPSWHPNGHTIAFVRRTAEGKRAIWTIESDGSSEKNLTGELGNFSKPVFSPQTVRSR